jgi:general secretion pathway protein N
MIRQNAFRVALCIAGVGLCALLVGRAAIRAPAAAASTDQPAAALQAPVDAYASAEELDGLVAAILDRPLFSPSRRPPQPPVVAPVAQRPPDLAWRLAGSTIRPGTREALFTQDGQQSRPVKEGDQLDGWNVSKIELDRVTLTSAFGTRVFEPTGLSMRTVARPVRRNARKAAKAAPGIAAAGFPARRANGPGRQND